MCFTKASVNQSFIWINPLGEGNKKKLQQHVVYHSLQSSSLSQRCRANYSKKPSLDSLIIIITIMARKAVPFEDKTTSAKHRRDHRSSVIAVWRSVTGAGWNHYYTAPRYNRLACMGGPPAEHQRHPPSGSNGSAALYLRGSGLKANEQVAATLRRS